MKLSPKTQKVISTSIISLAVLLFVFTLIFTGQVFIQGKVNAGVRVAGLNMSYKSSEAVAEAIAQKAQTYENQSFTISFDNETMTTTAKELGLEILPEETAKNLERNSYMEADLLGLITNESIDFPASTKIDSAKTIQKIDEKLNFSIIEAQNAAFFLDDKGRLQIKESLDGTKIDKEKLISELVDSASNMQARDIVIDFEQGSPEIKSQDLEATRPAIQAILNKQITLVDPIYSDPWKIVLSEHPDWVIFETKKPGLAERAFLSTLAPQTTIKIDPKAFDKFIDDEISKWLDHPVQPVNISRDPEGKVKIEGVGIDGTEIEREKLHKILELALTGNIKKITIPVKTIKPELIVSKDLQNLGIKEVVGIGHTSFYGSPANRVHNIMVSASRFDGALIAPGEEYSFNTNLGEVDESTGYRKELVIKPEGTIPEFGGGICQVSTTLYRALLFSDLPINERHSHSYAVSYYSQVLGDGLDATIYLGGPDLKFSNDTGHHLLMQFYLKDNSELYVIFYGTKKQEFEIKMEGPYISGYRNPGPTEIVETDTLAAGQSKQVSGSHRGFDVLWYKHTNYSDGSDKTEEIRTKYKAIPAKILVGPGGLPQEETTN